MARNIVNLEEVSKAFDIKELLISVSLGVSEGDRIGIVGRNGSGKSTLMKIMADFESPDSGRVTKSNAAKIGLLSQVDLANPESTVGEVVLGDSKKHEWASDPNIREVFTGLFGSFDDHIFDRKFGQLSGGERRRVGLAKLLINELDLILLDEPTNHLDVEGVAWLAQYLNKKKVLAVVVVTHDRWFLDAVTDRTWEVVEGKVEEYDGGYSAFVLAKAERIRQASAMDARRNNLIRKELAWLRRGAPARTTKPKFRVDAANVLIADEPNPRDQGELLKFALNRLGNTVYEAHHLQVKLGEKELIDDLYWNVGPGDRIGIVGVNGAGKTTLMRTLTGEIIPSAGKLVTGVTVKAAFLTQHLDELDPTWRVLEAVEKIANRVELGGGRELSASQLCERLGFDRESQWTPVGDLSGGEKRRLQLTRLLMDSPNVLLLDEPTNDFDIETLTELEDLLDSYGGVLIVISHDRYFLERVCDRFVGLLGDKKVRDLPRGVDEYLELRAKALDSIPQLQKEKKSSNAAEQRQLKKDLTRLDRQLEKCASQIKDLEAQQDAAAFDPEKLITIESGLRDLRAEKSKLEEDWLHTTLSLEN
ncbi:MAG: ATP-binding cassette domain-containing protein [Streptomycetaceae bacterium]|jgi:ATP-binding cassette subfamily F protein uup|nr:ATP-binding cassette domain-containing protein [Streptomycetaceae bacterium]